MTPDRVAVVAETLAGHRNLADGSCACGRWEVPQHEPWLPALEAHAAAAVVAALDAQPGDAEPIRS